MDRPEGFALDAPGGATVKRPRQNRVTPFGTIEATHHKGSLMGNRGDLHAPDGSLGREWRSRRWLSCILDGNGWKAPMDTRGHYYPLFFHDEAVALAAGHRPCGECRPDALRAFIAAWKKGNGFAQHERVMLSDIDRVCHHARISERKSRRLVTVSEMPNGVFVIAPEIDDRPLIVHNEFILPWGHEGYSEPIYKNSAVKCFQLTPEPMVAALRAGYVPVAELELQPVATFDCRG